MASELQCEIPTELQLVSHNISVKDLVERIANQLSTNFQIVQDTSEFQYTRSGPYDPKIDEAVKIVKKAVNLCFLVARAFMSKVHSFAQYVCTEEEHTITAIKEGNAEGYKAYGEGVLHWLKACQKDLNELTKVIENKGKTIDEKEKQVERRKKSASNDVDSADLHTAGGVVVFIGGVTVAAAVGGPVLTPVCLVTAISGLIYAARNADASKRYEKIAADCEGVLGVIRKMKSDFEEIEESLNSVIVSLEVDIKHNNEILSESELEELNDKKDATQRAIIPKVKELTKGAIRLKEYCQPLTESKNLKEFIKKVASIR